MTGGNKKYSNVVCSDDITFIPIDQYIHRAQ